jgi:hypothetical protein
MVVVEERGRRFVPGEFSVTFWSKSVEVLFCPMLPDMQKGVTVLEGFQASPLVLLTRVLLR